MRGFIPAGLVVICIASGFLAGSVPADADPLTRFFKSFQHPRHHQRAHRQKLAANATPAATNYVPSSQPVTQPNSPARIGSTATRAGAAFAPKKQPGEKLLAGIPVPDKPGFLRSPYTQNQAVIDVRGFPSGTEVVDPATGKMFVTP